MIQKNKTWCILLITIQLGCILTPSNAIFQMFGGGGGGGGGSDVAEILAAGLITKMLMEDFGGIGGGQSVFQTLRNQFMGGYSSRAPGHHHYQHMIAPRRPPIMHPYLVPMMHHRQQFMMNQAIMQQAAHQQALTAAWNNEYRALHGSESFANAYIPAIPTFGELLSDEDTLSAATILLNSDLFDSDEEEEEERKAIEAIQTIQPRSAEEEYETASSEHESRYILPRIVRHFVQRIMRRVEHH